MRPLTRDEVRGSIVNLYPATAKVRLPASFDETRWERIDYLGWRDTRANQRAYLVSEIDGEAHGVLLRQSPSQAALASRAVMCDLCRFTRRFNEVSLFTAPRASKDQRRRLSAVGLLLCTDLDCVLNVHRTPTSGPQDPPPEQIIENRRSGLRARTIDFLRSVPDTAGVARGPSR
ncbi:FBP domain-containing protein [Streptomyces sp. SCSIO 75703]|uniref:FBP domain-containing protein n=1 Tax=unclassified Streptomyces TaxID=2593676 RepID=UPI0004C22FAF|nr:MULTISPECIES: FBP domain-containing protein [unclassified Streptomyces]